MVLPMIYRKKRFSVQVYKINFGCKYEVPVGMNFEAQNGALGWRYKCGA